jgi:hypothetical protein
MEFLEFLETKTVRDHNWYHSHCVVVGKPTYVLGYVTGYSDLSSVLFPLVTQKNSGTVL